MSLAHEAFAEFDDQTADVRVSGRLDVKSRLGDDVARACAGGASLVLVDVGKVTTVTPSGMAELMHAVRWARSRQADLRIYGTSVAILDALDALDLNRVMVLYTDRAAAADRDQGRIQTVTRSARFARRRRLFSATREVQDASESTNSGLEATLPESFEMVTNNGADDAARSDQSAGADATTGSSDIADVAVIGVWDVSSSVHNDVGQLCADGIRLVLVDVSGVSRVTPSGMADLMNAVRSARRHRADLRIFGHSPAVADALDALGLGEILVLYPDRNAALIRERRVLDARSRGPRPMRTEMRPRSVGSN